MTSSLSLSLCPCGLVVAASRALPVAFPPSLKSYTHSKCIHALSISLSLSHLLTSFFPQRYRAGLEKICRITTAAGGFQN